MHVLQDFNKIVIHHEAEIIAYSSDILARYALGYSSRESLDATYEKIAGKEGSVLFCRAGQVGKRTMRTPRVNSSFPSIELIYYLK
jgi:RHO1 GDP-GTP exchange protein 1/2